MYICAFVKCEIGNRMMAFSSLALVFLSLICVRARGEIEYDFLNLVLNKCSNAVEIDTLELPSSWIGSRNQSEEYYDDWIQFSLVEQDPCEENKRHIISLSFDNSTTEYFSYNGYFRGGSVYYPPDAYCISNVTDTNLDVQICIPDCDKDLCFPKCCQPGKILAYDLKEPFSRESGKCTSVEVDWSPYLYEMLNQTHGKMRLRNSSAPVLPYYSVWTPQNCTMFGVTPHPNVPEENYFEILVMDSGHVYMRPKSEPRNGWHASSHNRFCIDGLWDSSSSDEFFPDETNQVIWACKELKEPVKMVSLAVVQSLFAFFCIAAFSLFLTFVAYVSVWESQSAYGWTIAMFSFAAMMDWGLFGAGLGVVLFHHHFVNTFGCKIMGVFWHFFHLATFSLMNVLNFDMWTNIRSFTAISLRSRGKRRFALYCCYGFGAPLIIVSISLGIQHHVSPSNVSIVRPNYGALWCGVSASAKFYYATLASVVMYSVNVLFGFLIFKTLREMKRCSAQADSSRMRQKELMGVLFLKMFVLMGLSFTLDFILSFLDGEAVKWLHIMVVLVTALRGPIIAWIFLSDQRVCLQLLDKFHILKALTFNSESKHSHTARSSFKRTLATSKTRNSSF